MLIARQLKRVRMLSARLRLMTADPAPAPLPESTHPYAVRVSLTLGSNVELSLSGDDVRLPSARFELA
jgi:hypothetical protein